jgi:hypothetical protein
LQQSGAESGTAGQQTGSAVAIRRHKPVVHKKKAAADATAFHDPDNRPAQAGRNQYAYLLSS